MAEQRSGNVDLPTSMWSGTTTWEDAIVMFVAMVAARMMPIVQMMIPTEASRRTTGGPTMRWICSADCYVIMAKMTIIGKI